MHRICCILIGIITVYICNACVRVYVSILQRKINFCMRVSKVALLFVEFYPTLDKDYLILFILIITDVYQHCKCPQLVYHVVKGSLQHTVSGMDLFYLNKDGSQTWTAYKTS